MKGMVMVKETRLPLTFSAPSMTDEEFRALCDEYPDFRLEYTADAHRSGDQRT